MESLENIYPVSRSYLSPADWETLKAQMEADRSPKDFPGLLAETPLAGGRPDFLSDLVRLEWALYQAGLVPAEGDPDPDRVIVNPTLQLLLVSHKNLVPLVKAAGKDESFTPEPGEERILVWRKAETGEVLFRAAREEDLLVLKLVLENTDLETAAAAGGVPPAAIQNALRRAAGVGLLIAPRSKIRRDPAAYPRSVVRDREFLESPTFTLQWHITQACDLHCKHCYDRSQRSPLTWEQGVRILNDLDRFCREKRVQGQVSFTGGNPLLHPQFNALYRAAGELGFGTAILGNPTSRERLQEIQAIQEPHFFQVSLEGLREHNDWIRGPGHFDRVMEFLEILKDLGIYSMVMLTLTRDNLGQVIPLAELLREKADSFFFNRLSQVGEGAQLQGPGREAYAAFLEAYLEAASGNPIMGLKDNLTNILRYRKSIPVFGGCTGYGCGAAFNFLTLLPDGEVHACRKLPSRIGNILETGLLEIYDSEEAQCYRSGTSACRACPIRPVCGGCLAVAYGMGLSIFQDRDPFCFMVR
jgi:selenobiotic family peptide radical SAM maturase